MSSETPSIRIALRANDLTEVEVYQDQPVTIRVTLGNHSATASASKNLSLVRKKREYDRKLANGQISPEEHEKAVAELQSKMAPSKVCRIGGPEAWPKVIKFQSLNRNQWQDVDWPLVLMIRLPDARVAEIGTKLCLAEFGLDPAVKAERPRGKFQLRAVVEIARDTYVQSNEVSINLLQKPMPQAEKKSERTLVDLGRYWYKRGLLEDAKKYAEEALQLNPNSIEAPVLLGDIHLKQERLSEALQSYKKALDQSSSLGLKERPDYVIRQMTKIRSMLREKEPPAS